MMRIIPKWRIAAALILLTALGTTACDKLGHGDDPTAPGPLPSGSTIIYGALGASDVIGFGSSVPCLPYADCAEGKGYVFVAARTLRGQSFTVNLSSLGLPTATISRAFQELGLRYNHSVLFNIIDSELPFVPREATVYSVFTGANDVNVITAALGGGAGGSNPAAFIDQQVQNFTNDYTTLFNGLRDRSPGVRIILLNVPNVGAMPFLASASPAQRQAAQRASVGMTKNAVNPFATQGARVIDVMCTAQLYQASYLSSDGFHPNDAGYAILANEVVRAITSATYPAPQASCPQMAVVP
jgi:lysophospholipase L1-like esterase